MNSQLKLAAYLAGVSAAALTADTLAEVIYTSGVVTVEDDDPSTSGTEFFFFHLPEFAFNNESNFSPQKGSAGKKLLSNSLNFFPEDKSDSGTTPHRALGQAHKASPGKYADESKSVLLTLAEEGEFLDGQDFSPGTSEVELNKPTDSSYLGFEWDHFTFDSPMYGWLEYATDDSTVSAFQIAINTGPGGITVGQTSSVPEPTTLALMMAGVAGIAAARKRRGAKASR